MSCQFSCVLSFICLTVLRATVTRHAFNVPIPCRNQTAPRQIVLQGVYRVPYKKSSLYRRKERYVKTYKSRNHCQRCHTSKDLTFHHLQPEKKRDRIPMLIRDEHVTLKELQEEIRGCIILCLSCHRLTHLLEDKGVVHKTRSHE